MRGSILRRALAPLLLLTLLPITAIADDAHKEDVEKWYAGRIERLTSDTGYLSLVGLFELAPGDNRFGSGEENELVFPGKAPGFAGTIHIDSASIELTVADGVTILHDETAVTSMKLHPDTSDKLTQLEMDSFVFYVIERAGKLYLRLKDRESEALKNFKSIERYPVDEKWRVEAMFTPYDPPLPVRSPNFMGYEVEYPCPGELTFEIDGEEYKLEPLYRYEDEFFVVFGDETSGIDTYGGGRFLYIPAREDAGIIVMDFNRSYNPPCVFTPFATCPLPRPSDVVPVPIEAGEKGYVTGPNH